MFQVSTQCVIFVLRVVFKFDKHVVLIFIVLIFSLLTNKVDSFQRKHLFSYSIILETSFFLLFDDLPILMLITLSLYGRRIGCICWEQSFVICFATVFATEYSMYISATSLHFHYCICVWVFFYLSQFLICIVVLQTKKWYTTCCNISLKVSV